MEQSTGGRKVRDGMVTTNLWTRRSKKKTRPRGKTEAANRRTQRVIKKLVVLAKTRQRQNKQRCKRWRRGIMREKDRKQGKEKRKNLARSGKRHNRRMSQPTCLMIER